MDTEKRIIIWVSVVLVLAVTVIGVWKGANIPTSAKPITLSKLIEAVLPTDWTKGAETPKVSLVEYSDFQCPACGAYYPLVEKVFTGNKNSLAFTYRHFPLPQHKNALAAAYAAEAAGAQGKFWQMHEMIFSHQADWSDSDTAEAIFEGYATELKLDMKNFKEVRDSQVTKDNVAHDAKTGTDSGVNSTPSFYINGEKIANPRSAEEFDALIKKAISNE